MGVIGSTLPSREGKIKEWTIVCPPSGSSLGPRIWTLFVAQRKIQIRFPRGKQWKTSRKNIYP